MTLHRHALSVLVLFVGGGLLAPVVSPAAGADVILKKFVKEVGEKNDVVTVRPSVVVDDDQNNVVAAVELSVRSDAGNEDLELTETDAWLHGAATLSALPVKDAALSLTLYDKGSASLMSFSGTLATDGTVTLTEVDSRGSCEVWTRLGCEAQVAYDVEILAAEVYRSGKSYTLTLDLAGADTYEVAYATLEVSGGEKAEVDWDAVGSVWTGESTLEHSGEIDVRAKVLDAGGDTIDNVKAELGEPWGDDGGGVNVLWAGSGTSVAVHRVGREISWRANDEVLHGRWDDPYLTVVSDGWTTTEYPTHAELELAGGDTVSVPANSYQRVGSGNLSLHESARFLTDPSSSVSITGGNFKLSGASPSDLSSPVCSEGTCVVLVEGEKGYEIAFTAYGYTPSDVLTPCTTYQFSVELSGLKVASETIDVTYDDAVTAVFTSELDIDGDPMGADASGSVRLLGTPGKKGKQATLSKGTFYGSFSRDSDGDLGLGGYGTDDGATSDSSAGVLLGDPVECGGAGCDGDWAPPVVAYRPRANTICKFWSEPGRAR